MSEFIKLLDYAKTIENPIVLLGFFSIIVFLLLQRFTDSEFSKGKRNYNELESRHRMILDDNSRLRKENSEYQQKIEVQAREIEELYKQQHDLLINEK